MSLDSGVIDVVQHHLNGVRKSGPENVMAICPFHLKDGRPERTPSFAISTVTGLWFCHACHERGNLRSFLRALGATPRHIETFYKPLLEELDGRVQRQKYLEDSRKGFNDRNVTYGNETGTPFLEESALGLFDYVPLGLLEEGFSETTLRHFDVGYDQKHRRITFPIRDLTGHIVGISGRTVDADNPQRYKVYARDEYLHWGLPVLSTDKSRILWNIDKVYPAIFHSNGKEPLFIVEGFKACMWLHQAGYKNTVALMGSFLSPYQERLIERLSQNIYLFLDNGSAGQKGTFYSGRTLNKKIQSVRVVQYEESQPTDLTPAQVQEAVNHAVDFFTWAI